MRMRAYDKIIDNCKRLSQMHQFRAEPLLLLLGALGGGGIKAHQAWQGVAIQKFIHRELRIYDDAIKGSKLHYSAKAGRWAQRIKAGLSRPLGDVLTDDDEGQVEEAEEGERTSAREMGSRRRSSMVGAEEAELDLDDDDVEGVEDEVPRPTVPSPNFNTIYGQIMLSNKSYQTALCRSYLLDSRD
jgi:general transcription factor 3C polypeptide 3 (transcription factor C subunit 4)